MNRPSLLAALRDRPLVVDGAMGTQLFDAGLAPGACGEKWNLDRTEQVVAIHRRYMEAGCDCVTTNTFGASPMSLARHELQNQVEAINRAGAELARRAVGDKGWVLADVGPFGGFLEPIGDTPREAAIETFIAQLRALHEGGADAVIIETMSDIGEMSAAIEAAKKVAHWPVVATYAFETGGRTMMGVDVEGAVKGACDAGADVVGANCGTGLDLDAYAHLAEAIVTAAGATPVILQPNAGKPLVENGRTRYAASCQDMAGLATKLRNAGVRMIGGCCGTTPDHLRAMAAAVRKR